MNVARKSDLDRRLEAHFANLRSLPLREALKRSAANWQIYAAVTGSAVAMATGASASILGNGARDMAAAAIASVLAAKPFASSRNTRLMQAVKMQAVTLNGAAANIGLSTAAQAPSIPAGGVVPAFGSTNTIQPGEWVTIYGANLASTTVNWNGDFPISLGGTSVAINGKAAYLAFVSPGQINLQAPDDTALGTVSVVVTTAAGSATSYVTLNEYAPTFNLLDAKHVSGIILRSNHTGAFGGGTYDMLGPTGNSLGYPTVAAKPGDSVELFAYGLGPTTPNVPAGQAFSSAAPVNNAISIYISNIYVTPSFVGLSSAGLYQINLVIPGGIGGGDASIQAIAGGMPTQPGIFIPLQTIPVITTSPAPGGGGTYFPTGGGGLFFGTTGGGGTGGGTGGGGTGSDRTHKRKPYQPKLQFPPK